MREFGRTRHELGHPAVTADSGCSFHVPSFSGDLVRPRLAGNMSEMLVGVRGFEPPAPASRKHCSTCPGRDHLFPLSTASPTFTSLNELSGVCQKRSFLSRGRTRFACRPNMPSWKA